MSDARNVLGGLLQVCSVSPMTGFGRDGVCHTGPHDIGSHTVCAQMTEAFLEYSLQRGNDLVTPVPEYDFPGLKPGDRWCVCAARWIGPADANFTPALLRESDGCKARRAGKGHPLAKRRNAADALSRSNPKGRADSGASLCREPLAVNDTAARPASRAASRIGLVAGVKLASAGPRAAEDGVAPPVILDATHARALRHVALADLQYHALRTPDYPSQEYPKA